VTFDRAMDEFRLISNDQHAGMSSWGSLGRWWIDFLRGYEEQPYEISSVMSAFDLPGTV
jgi:hypothetical protein